MGGEPAEPLSPAEDAEDVAALLRRQVARLKRWVEWELWLYEPRSFSPPEESVREQDGDDAKPGDREPD